MADNNKWDGKFNGTYETSKYAERTLEEEILDCGCGIYAYPDEDGNLEREIDGVRFDNWYKGDNKGHYSHFFYNAVTGEYGKADDDRHDEKESQ